MSVWVRGVCDSDSDSDRDSDSDSYHITCGADHKDVLGNNFTLKIVGELVVVVGVKQEGVFGGGGGRSSGVSIGRARDGACVCV